MHKWLLLTYHAVSWKPKVLVLGQVSKAICFLPGPAFHWWWYRQSRWQCVLSSSVSFWSPDGKQATVLCTWELLEGISFLFRIYTFLLNNEPFLFLPFSHCRISRESFTSKSKCVEIMFIGEVFLIFTWSYYLFILDTDLQDVE